MKKEPLSPPLRRLRKLRERMAQEKIEALLVGSLPNVHYLTGFSGTAGVLLVTLRSSVFFTDARYDLRAHQEVQGSRVVITKGGNFLAALKWASRTKQARLGFESDSVSFGSYQRIRQLIVDKRLVPTSGMVESCRIQKDEAEI